LGSGRTSELTVTCVSWSKTMDPAPVKFKTT
jgi:hypothetical protein